MMERVKPRFCSIDIIDECVLQCKMCYKWKDKVDRSRLVSRDGWYRFIDSLKLLYADESIEVIFAGGETFLYKPLFDIIRYAGEKGFQTAIASSGFLMNRDIALRLADAKLTNITFSLDSLDGRIHDFLRGRQGVFESVLRAIDSFDGIKVNISISAIIMDINLEEITKMAEWINGNDKIETMIFLLPMQPNSTAPTADWYKDKEVSFMWPQNIKKACEVIDTLISMKRLDEERGVKSKIYNSFAQLDAFKSYFEDPHKFAKKSKCPLTHALHVTSFGDIFFCYSQPSIGNIKQDLIHEIWNSDRSDRVRTMVGNCRKNCHFLLNCFFEE